MTNSGTSKTHFDGQVNPFVHLASIDLTQYIDAKKNQEYLPWAIAVAKIREFDPAATWQIAKFPLTSNPALVAPYLETPLGFIVQVSLTFKGVARTMQLPVLMQERGQAQQPNMKPTCGDINKACMRCLAKVCAAHGLGISVFAKQKIKFDAPVAAAAVGSSAFMELASVDVGPYVKALDEAGTKTYLPWPPAMAKICEFDPNMSWEIKTFPFAGDPGLRVPYMECADVGFFVEVDVTCKGITQTAMLPVLNNSQKANMKPGVDDINAAHMRAFVKACAYHGLGLYLYTKDGFSFEGDSAGDEHSGEAKQGGASKQAAADPGEKIDKSTGEITPLKDGNKTRSTAQAGAANDAPESAAADAGPSASGGKKAEPEDRRITPAQAKELNDLLVKLGKTQGPMLVWLGLPEATPIANLTVSQFERCKVVLTTPRRKQA